jgi:hypothetical protein
MTGSHCRLVQRPSRTDHQSAPVIGCRSPLAGQDVADRSLGIELQFDTARVELTHYIFSTLLAEGGDKVFCGEIADPRRGEDETRDGRLFAWDIATGELLWQREGGARLRYSPTLDIVVTPVGYFRGTMASWSRV